MLGVKNSENSITNNNFGAYIEKMNKVSTIDVELLDYKLLKRGYTPLAPSSSQNMVIDIVGDACYRC